jgi:Domain of Unknown Function (DUF1206)
MSGNVRTAASQAGNHPVLELGARLGYAASGLLHLLIGWIILQLAWTGTSQQADQQGALETLAGNGFGRALLWLALVGFALLALWQVTEAVARTETKDRLKAVGKAVINVVLAWTAWSVLQGTTAGGGGGGLAAGLMSSTGGRVLVGLIGLGVVGVGAYHVVKGWKRTFLRDLRENPGRWAERAGRVGYIAKGVALAVVGGLLVTAAVQNGAAQAQGLDAALHTVAALPLGAVLLTLAGLGFAAYGVYAFARARYARV